MESGLTQFTAVIAASDDGGDCDQQTEGGYSCRHSRQHVDRQTPNQSIRRVFKTTCAM